MTNSWRWYAARARAMSPREVVWRAYSTVSLPAREKARRRTRRQLHWSTRELREASRRVFAPQPDLAVAEAERLAAGELELWGRRIDVNLRRTEWRRDPFSGTVLPGLSWRQWHVDPKPLWELHRHQHVLPLAAGAAIAEKQDWSRLAADHLLDWIARNPPGTVPAWNSGYEVAHRLVGWALAVPLLVDVLRGDELDRIGDTYKRQASFLALRPSRFSSANNHRLAELAGLLAASLVGVEKWEPHWRELEWQVLRQTYSDGGSREQAAGYFLYVLEILWLVGLLAQISGRDLGQLDERLETMLHWLAMTSDASGEPPPVGDDAEDRILRLPYFGRRRAEEIAGRVRRLLRRDLGHPTDSVVLAVSGYAVLRSTDVRVVFDVGQLGLGSLAAHGHADALSVLVDTGDGTLLRDSGTGAYAPPSVREPFRLTAAHNTVVLDGESQAQPLGPHLWGRRFRTTLEAAQLSHGVDAVRASHDGYFPAIHARSVVFVKPDLLIVLDRVEADRSREATLVWQGETKSLATVSSPASVRIDGLGSFSPRYTHIAHAPRATWTARARRVLFATGVGLDGRPPAITLREEDGVTVVEVEQPRRVRVTERWAGPAAEVET